MARKILALLPLLFATPAVAATYVGTVSGFDYRSIPIPTGPGTYQLRFAFSSAVPWDVTIYSEEHYDMYDAKTLEYFGGNDSALFDTREYYTPTRSGTLQWTIARPYRRISKNVLSTGYFSGVQADVNFYGDPDTSVTYQFDVTAVPEPAEWMLLIGGFGLAGAALRRRTRASARPAPAA